jgi:hypothetical protein
MMRWQKVVIALIGAAVWLALSWLVTSRMSDEVAWYHWPFLVPVAAAVMIGGAHNPSSLVGNVVWILQSLAVGAFLAWMASRGSGSSPKKPNQAPEPTTVAVTPRAPSSTSRAGHGRGSS